MAIEPKMDNPDLGLIGMTIWLVTMPLGFCVMSVLTPFYQSGRMRKIKVYQIEAPPRLSTSKVYQIEELPPGTRCMVSHLEIHLEIDELVACPYCEGIAKKELLEEWLEEKSICPACRRRLQIEDCPEVQLKGAK